MHNGFEMLKYFWMKQWSFHSENTRRLMNTLAKHSAYDSRHFPFDVSVVDWPLLTKNSWYGGRRYLLKEDDDNIPKAKRRLTKIIYGYRIFLFLWYSALTYVMYLLTNKLVSTASVPIHAIDMWRSYDVDII
ncbi:unnamed protein product, partial [Medioppia subpectinata]